MIRARTRLAKSSSIRSLGVGVGWACGVEVGGTTGGGGSGVAAAAGGSVGGGSGVAAAAGGCGVAEGGAVAECAALAAVSASDSVSERWSALLSERRVVVAAVVSRTTVKTVARATAVGR